MSDKLVLAQNVPYNNRAWRHQGFQILDANGKVIDGVGQFLYKSYCISLSSWNYSRGGCLNEVAVFCRSEDGSYSDWLQKDGDRVLFHSAEEAIQYIDQLKD